VTATWLEYRDVATHVAAGDDTRSANKCSCDVGKDAAILLGFPSFFLDESTYPP
jgi:hypothetical protein